MITAKISSAAEDYIKAIYLLGSEQTEPVGPEPSVATTALAERLGVSAASATNMLKRLAEMGLVTHVPYKGAALTDHGRNVALEVIRHHRLLETYLAEALGVPWDQVHKEAEVLEHVLSEELEERIAAVLGDPVTDPHGHPIPTKDGAVRDRSARRLWDVEVGQGAKVESVPDSDDGLLRYLDEAGVRPGVSVEVTRRGPLSGPLFILVANKEHALSQEVAEAVCVQ
jgi:DtxR family Mn-dependent transcriptional regulator